MALNESIDHFAKKLYLAQHGLAVDKTVDPERPLSEIGIAQTQAIARRLRDAEVSIDNIIHSGKRRAEQTAEIFATILNVETVSANKHLTPNEDITLIAQALTKSDTLIVGHLPHLDKLLSHLITGDETARIQHFQNSAVTCLQKSENHYQIKWICTPELSAYIE